MTKIYPPSIQSLRNKILTMAWELGLPRDKTWKSVDELCELAATALKAREEQEHQIREGKIIFNIRDKDVAQDEWVNRLISALVKVDKVRGVRTPHDWYAISGSNWSVEEHNARIHVLELIYSGAEARQKLAKNSKNPINDKLTDGQELQVHKIIHDKIVAHLDSWHS